MLRDAGSSLQLLVKQTLSKRVHFQWTVSHLKFPVVHFLAGIVLVMPTRGRVPLAFFDVSDFKTYVTTPSDF